MADNTLIFRLELDDRASDGVESFKKKLKDLQEYAEKVFSDFGGGMFDGFTSALSGFGQAIIDIGSTVISTFADMGKAVWDFTKESINVFGDFEQGMLEIEKAAGGTEEELKKVGDALREAAIMDLKGTTTVEELQAIAAAAGKFGIATKDLDTFSVSIAKMADMWDLTVEKTGESAAKLISQYKLSASQIENVGSAVDGVADSFATSEAYLLNFSQRLSGTAKATGQTLADVLAMGARIAVETGMAAEAGSTAYQKVFQQMLDNYQIFAKKMGMSSDQFKKLIETDGAEAFNQLLLYLEKIKNAEGPTGMLAALDDLNLKGGNVQKLLLGMIGTVDGNRAAMEKANITFMEGTRISENFARSISGQNAGWTQWIAVIQEVYRSFGEVLAPAVQIFQQILSEQVIPVIMEFVNWLKQSEETTKFFGEVLPEQLKTLGLYFKDLSIIAFEFIKSLDWSAILEKISTLIQDAIAKIGEFIPIVITFFTETIPAAIKIGIAAMETILPIIEKIMSGFAALLKYVTPIKDALSGLFDDLIAGNFEETILPVIEKIKAGFAALLKYVTPIKDALSGLFDDLMAGNFDEVLSKVKDFISQMIAAITDGLTTSTMQVSPILSEIFTHLSGTIRSVIDIAVLAVQTALSNATEFFRSALAEIDVTPLKDAFANMGQVVETLWSALDQLFGTLSSVLDQLFRRTEQEQTAFTTLGRIANAVLQTIIDLIGMAAEGWANIATWFSPEVWQGLGEELIAWIDRAIASIENLGRDITEFLTNPLDAFGQMAASVFNEMIGWVGKAAGYIVDLGSKLKNIIADLAGIDDEGVKNSTWPDMYQWVGKNIKEVGALQSQLTGLNSTLAGMTQATIAPALRNPRVLPAPAPITAAAPPSSAAPMNRTASQAQTSSSSSRNAQVTINFSGQNIIDESSKERFLREIMAQMSAMIGKTVTV